jgi:hypothetical protein
VTDPLGRLVDFFSSCDPGTLKDYKQLFSLHSHSDSSGGGGGGAREADASAFKSQLRPEVEADMKLLYTAITRCKARLVLIETGASGGASGGGGGGGGGGGSNVGSITTVRSVTRAFFRWVREKGLAQDGSHLLRKALGRARAEAAGGVGDGSASDDNEASMSVHELRLRGVQMAVEGFRGEQEQLDNEGDLDEDDDDDDGDGGGGGERGGGANGDREDIGDSKDGGSGSRKLQTAVDCFRMAGKSETAGAGGGRGEGGEQHVVAAPAPAAGLADRLGGQDGLLLDRMVASSQYYQHRRRLTRLHRLQKKKKEKEKETRGSGSGFGGGGRGGDEGGSGSGAELLVGGPRLGRMLPCSKGCWQHVSDLKPNSKGKGRGGGTMPKDNGIGGPPTPPAPAAVTCSTCLARITDAAFAERADDTDDDYYIPGTDIGRGNAQLCSSAGSGGARSGGAGSGGAGSSGAGTVRFALRTIERCLELGLVEEAAALCKAVSVVDGGNRSTCSTPTAHSTAHEGGVAIGALPLPEETDEEGVEEVEEARRMVAELASSILSLRQHGSLKLHRQM